MAKLSLTELQNGISAYVVANALSNGVYQITRNNIADLLDKIGKQYTLDTDFGDKLAIFDKETLEYGKDIEEWQQDLLLPMDYDPTGANNMAPNDPSYRPPFYSKSLGKKVFPTTIRQNNLERACLGASEFTALTAMILKRLYDSETVWRYGIKRQLLGELAKLCITAVTTGAAQFNINTAYEVGAYVKETTYRGIVVKKIASSNTNAYETCRDNGYIIDLSLVTEMAAPTDTATAEAFITEVKKDVEIASDISEGHSLNGNTLGVIASPLLIVKQGIMPTIDTQALAGAFNQDKLAIPAEVIVVKDFGDADSKVFAMLVDNRIVGLHPTYKAVREDMNGKGDFINYYLHAENTGYISRNAFVKIYKEQ